MHAAVKNKLNFGFLATV